MRDPDAGRLRRRRHQDRAPGTGDLSRTSFSDDPAGLLGPVYCSLNRNKRSIVLDSATAGPRHRAQLIETADVVVNNFRAGVMERMGFGYEELSKHNPRLIYAVGTGFGLTGPYSHKGGQDVLAQAMSGVMAARSDPMPLSIYPTTFADYSAGMHMVQGVLLALLQREQDRARPEHQRVALRFDAGGADPGGRAR